MGIAIALLVSCASAPTPSADLARAETSIRSAKQARAGELAPLPLQEAEKELARARDLAEGDHELEAARAAERSAANGELATAEARKAQAQESVTELERTLQALRQETHE